VTTFLVTNAYSPTQNLPGGLCATLAQTVKSSQIHVTSHASRQLKENEKNYSPFLLETSAAVWGMDNFNEYLKGSKLTLYADPTLAPNMGTLQTKTLNQLWTAMMENNFVTRSRQISDLPADLKNIFNHPTKCPRTLKTRSLTPKFTQKCSIEKQHPEPTSQYHRCGHQTLSYSLDPG
jgi:RNase H-like domain found in reverse transcriptase